MTAQDRNPRRLGADQEEEWLMDGTTRDWENDDLGEGGGRE